MSPERIAAVKHQAADEAARKAHPEHFPALRMPREAGLGGPRATAALIAADDVAVARFLAGSLDFPGIPRLLEAAVARTVAGDGEAQPALDELLALDADVRGWAGRWAA